MLFVVGGYNHSIGSGALDGEALVWVPFRHAAYIWLQKEILPHHLRAPR